MNGFPPQPQFSQFPSVVAGMPRNGGRIHSGLLAGMVRNLTPPEPFFAEISGINSLNYLEGVTKQTKEFAMSTHHIKLTAEEEAELQSHAKSLGLSAERWKRDCRIYSFILTGRCGRFFIASERINL